MTRSLFSPARILFTLIGMFLLGILPGAWGQKNIPVQIFRLDEIPIKYPQKTWVTTLLLQPDQITQIQKAWETYQQDSQEMKKAGKKSLDVVNKARAARITFESTRTTVLTEKQNDVRTLILQLARQAEEEVRLEFSAELDAAFTPEEKKPVLEKRGKATHAYFIETLKAELPPENWKAFESELSP